MLNEPLYKLLQQTFGHVKIEAGGEQFRYRVERGLDGSKKFKRVTGEEYLVNCPVCGHISKKKFRLSISYMYGQRLPEGVTYWGAHCWNMNCKVGKFLRDMMAGKELPVVAKVQKVEYRSFEDIAVDCVRNVETPIVRPASLSEQVIDYLVNERKFMDPLALERTYGIGQIIFSQRMIATTRLYIPMRWADTAGKEYVVSWQGREILGREDVPKYFTAPGSIRGAFLYGQPAMRYYPGGVLLEGPTDCWRVGFPAVGMWGKDLTHYQAMAIAQAWGATEYPIVVYGDPGFEKSAADNVLLIQSMVANPQRVFYIIPEHDAGSDSHLGVWGRIDHECVRRSLPLLPRRMVAA